MSEQEARRQGEAQRAEHRVPVGWEEASAEQRWIELADGAGPSPVRDLRVWVVRYGSELQWIDLAIDDASGRVVRVERSR